MQLTVKKEQLQPGAGSFHAALTRPDFSFHTQGYNG